MNKRNYFGTMIVAMITLLIPTLVMASAEKEIILFHAGSLSKPMAEIETAFERLHPDIDVKREAGGSRKLARKIIELDGKCDVYFSADYNVIQNMLRPEFADWNIMFATNELVLMYGPESLYADEINSDNWYQILLKDDVSWGNSEPDLDPCGYRAMMVLQLAEEYYGEQGLYERSLQDQKHFTRPKAIELVAQVESGVLDYAFEYRSVAVQHGFDFVEFPAEINLRDVEFEDYYSQAKVVVAGKEPGTTKTLTGAPIVYGFTITRQAPNPELAMEFAKFAMSEERGLKVFKEMGQGIVGPASAGSDTEIPTDLKPFLAE